MPLSYIQRISRGLSCDARSGVKFWLYIYIHNITPCAFDYTQIAPPIASLFFRLKLSSNPTAKIPFRPAVILFPNGEIFLINSDENSAEEITEALAIIFFENIQSPDESVLFKTLHRFIIGQFNAVITREFNRQKFL